MTSPATSWPAKVQRRDGTLVPFDIVRIETAITRAAREVAFRYGSRAGQVLTYAASESLLAQAETEFSGGCAGRGCEF